MCLIISIATLLTSEQRLAHSCGTGIAHSQSQCGASQHCRVRRHFIFWNCRPLVITCTVRETGDFARFTVRTYTSRNLAQVAIFGIKPHAANAPKSARTGGTREQQHRVRQRPETERIMRTLAVLNPERAKRQRSVSLLL
jgi:hypothetical protein